MIVKKRKFIFIFSSIVLSFNMFLSGCTSKKASAQNSNNFKNTIITPHMEYKLKKGSNIVYCSTFQLAWNELKDNMIKEDIKLAEEEETVKNLNKSLSTKKDLSDKDYVAMVGYAKDGILEKINKELKSKFGNNAEEVKANFQRPDDILAYAFLLKELKFKNKFEKIKEPLVFNSENKVKYFGIERMKYDKKHDEISEQVEILDYKDNEDFVIKLVSQSENDEIVLAKIPYRETLHNTIEEISKRAEGKETQRLREGDRLMIPCFDFNINHNYKNLEEKYFMNKDFEDYKISKACQSIKFSLNEKGAKLKSEARIEGTKSAAVVDPKNLVFDKPFLLMLREKGSKEPYLAIWVENSEILVKD